MSKNTQYNGIILRSETVERADSSGYIEFLITNGKKVGVGADVYLLDETGAMHSYLESEHSEEISLNEKSAAAVRKTLSAFSSEFSDTAFKNIYNVKSVLDNAILESSEKYNVENLDLAMQNAGLNVTRSACPYSGIISYDIDGYENMSAESITIEDMNREQYSSQHIKSGQLVENSAPVYRIVTSETWSIIFPVKEEDRSVFNTQTALTVKFRSPSIKTSGAYSQYNGADGNTYGRLTFDKYMIDFLDDRFISFDIESDAKSGLKIPKTAVVTKDFFIVPKTYLTNGGDSLEEGFLKTDANSVSTVFVPSTVYYSDENYAYIDSSEASALKAGDILLMPKTSERFQISQTAPLNGVYNINKGYAVFKQIDVIDANDEYYTVRKNQKYGLSVYDHILFNPAGINEGDFIYK